MTPVRKAMIWAPLVPGLIWALLMFNPVVLLFAIPLGYLGMFAFGLPLYLLVRRYWRVSLLSSALCGALSGALACLVFAWWDNATEISRWFGGGIILFALFGLVAGISFWFIGAAQQGVAADRPRPAGEAGG